jgi:hypothetical protein
MMSCHAMPSGAARDWHSALSPSIATKAAECLGMGSSGSAPADEEQRREALHPQPFGLQVDSQLSWTPCSSSFSDSARIDVDRSPRPAASHAGTPCQLECQCQTKQLSRGEKHLQQNSSLSCRYVCMSGSRLTNPQPLFVNSSPTKANL